MPPSRPLAEEARQLFDSKSEVGTGRAEAKSVDTSQLHQSRLGLLSQAVMMLVVVIFLCSETLGEFWKSKVPIYSRNWHNLVFRVVEIGVALWFPCVLWNCMSPEELWILNPKRLLKRKDSLVDKGGAGRPGPSRETWEKQETASNGSDGSGDCWICYDPGRSDAGPLIQPCQCKGDVRTVHHNCLLKWLMERSNKTTKTGMRCGVCGSEYRISFAGKVDFSRLLTSQSWAQTVATIGAISLAAVSSCLVVQYVGNAVAKALLVGSALLVIYVCTKFFCQKQIEAYQRAKVSTVNIESSNGAAGISVAVPTISDSLEEIPSSVKAGKGKKAMMAMKQSSSTSSLMMMKPSSNVAMKHSSSVSSLAMKSSAVDPSTDALLPPKSSPRDKGVVEL